MTWRAWVYVGFILFTGLVMACAAVLISDLSIQPWPLIITLVVLATITQLFNAEAPTHQLYHPSLLFSFACILLLEPVWYLALLAVTHAAEWVKEFLTGGKHLRAWYLQPFNFSTHLCSGLIAGFVYRLINPVPGELTSLAAMAGAGVGALIYVLLNHLIVGEALWLARNVSWKQSGILNFENLSTDFVMLMLGYVAAIPMASHPWLILPVLTPLYLIYRALAVPILKQQASTDPKTGLWNADYFIKALDSELKRSGRYARPLTVVMADLDFLRNINNAYGHLAGDAVLRGAAAILKSHFREYDIVSRFGGEEFAILMPETAPLEAYSRIEAIREAVERHDFEAPISRSKIKVTMSFGLASNSGMAQTVKEIIHCADVAVYQAKLEGRNRTKIYSEDVAYSLGIYHLEESEALGEP